MLKEEFTEWANNGGIRSQDSGYISHAIDVLEWWLDSKLPNADVGNLFRYETLAEFEEKLKQIKNDVDFYEVNRKDQRGRPQAALNKYTEFLKGRNYIPVIHKHNEVMRNMKDTEYYKDLLVENKNLILHGAPGTGKTYLAKEIAKEMGCSDNEIGFVQFHPSYDYTDFVEGIRPNNNNGFERKDGIFKAFCKKAVQNILDSTKSASEIQKELSWNDKVILFLDNAIEQKTPYPLKNGGNVIIESYHEDIVDISLPDNIAHKDDKIHISKLLKILNAEQEFEKAIEIEKFINEYHSAEYSYLLAIYKAIKSYNFDPADLNTVNVQKVDEKNFVFIIDEINRGEISKILGELFFSIDPGYRGEEGLVNTQYQNLILNTDIFSKGFFIPKNVYIIGTMNDIDRSVESMDFAMRRRFIFEEVTAEDSAENMNLSQDAKDRMTRINKAIHDTEGLNDAYKIGGAYFLNADDFDKLWKIKLSSLVKEYLRGIDDDGSKYKKIEDAYFNRPENNFSDNGE